MDHALAWTLGVGVALAVVAIVVALCCVLLRRRRPCAQWPVVPPKTSLVSSTFALKTMTTTAGEVRQYWLSMPTTCSSTGLAPVVFYFHGTTKNPPSPSTMFDSLADSHVLVAPVGLTNADGAYSWNVKDGVDCNSQADDIAFVANLLDSLASAGGADMRRVVATGFSVGSAFVARLSATPTLSAKFLGFAPLSGRVGSTASGSTALESLTSNASVFATVGALDKLIPWKGGPSSMDCYDLASHYEYLAACVENLAGPSMALSLTEAAHEACVEGIATSKTDYCETQWADGARKVRGVVFGGTAHTPVSDSVSTWLAAQPGAPANRQVAAVQYLLEWLLRRGARQLS